MKNVKFQSALQFEFQNKHCDFQWGISLLHFEKLQSKCTLKMGQ